jgi:hypothetical protein
MRDLEAPISRRIGVERETLTHIKPGADPLSGAATEAPERTIEAEPDPAPALETAMPSATDVGEVALWMTSQEADALLRSAMEVSWVAEDNGPWDYDGARPYRNVRFYISKDRGQLYALFTHPDDRNQIVAVVRQIVLPEGISQDAMRDQLIAKYGTPAAETTSQLLWTESLGLDAREKPGRAAMDLFLRGGCGVELLGGPGQTELTFLEGERTSDLSKSDSALRIRPKLSVRGGRSQGGGGEPAYDPSQWVSCGPAIIARFRSSNGRAYLQYGVWDLSAYDYPTDIEKIPELAVPKL